MYEYEIDEILAIAKANEEIARKLFEIELKILTIKTFKGLFEELLILIEEKLQVPHVWLSIIDHSPVTKYIQALHASSFLKQRVNTIPRRVMLDLFGHSMEPILACSNLKPYFRLLPSKEKYFIRSLAIAPVELDGNCVGSLNMADFSEHRFQPDMDTFFLSQLVVKVSICLANVTAHEELKRLATRDPLTDLLNRREMEATLKQEFNRMLRYGQPLALLFVDCDDFKKVNDCHGHDCGDAVLQYVANHLRNQVRPSDMIFRFAGDEFVIILPHQSVQDAQVAANRLKAFFESHPLPFGGQLIPISISIGVASSDEPGVSDSESLLKMADSRLYESKRRLSTEVLTARKIV